MRLGFEEAQTPYESPSQRARVWTEKWVSDQLFCPNCGKADINKFGNNQPIADFFAPRARKNTSSKVKNTSSVLMCSPAHFALCANGWPQRTILTLCF